MKKITVFLAWLISMPLLMAQEVPEAPKCNYDLQGGTYIYVHAIVHFGKETYPLFFQALINPSDTIEVSDAGWEAFVSDLYKKAICWPTGPFIEDRTFRLIYGRDIAGADPLITRYYSKSLEDLFDFWRNVAYKHTYILKSGVKIYIRSIKVTGIFCFFYPPFNDYYVGEDSNGLDYSEYPVIDKFVCPLHLESYSECDLRNVVVK